MLRTILFLSCVGFSLSARNRVATSGCILQPFYSSDGKDLLYLPSKLSELPPSPRDGWRRVGYLDMLNLTQKCPPTWKENSRKKACGRINGGTCDSVILPTGNSFRQVCGWFKGYQWGNTDAFAALFVPKPVTIDQPYVDGISITYKEGTQRQHIFTYASALMEQYTPAVYPQATCPCAGGAPPPPLFVRYADHYCESGNPTQTVYSDQIFCDQLWDGQQCRYSETSCCDPPKLQPWFCRDLEQDITSPIEIRICSDEGTASEDIALESYELYVR